MTAFVPAKWYRSGRSMPLLYVTIHDMEAPEAGDTAESVARYFQTLPDTRKASAHVCVDNNSVVECVHPQDTAYHAPGVNGSGYGVEHAGYARQTRAQWLDAYDQGVFHQAAAWLVPKVIIPYGIPVKTVTDADLSQYRGKGFVTHAQVTRVFRLSTHTDPGTGFPMDVYLETVAKELARVKAGRVTIPVSTPPVQPRPTLPAVLPLVSASKIKTAALQGPAARPGVTTYAYGTQIVERALVAEGLLERQYVDGQFGSKTVAAYAAWQRRCAARLKRNLAPYDGIPGALTLALLGKAHGFRVGP